MKQQSVKQPPENPNSTLVEERIVQGAQRVFRTFGFAKTTMADIARESGISKAYLYRFYSSKLEVAEAVAKSTTSELTDMLWMEARSSIKVEEKVERIFTRLTEETVRLFFEKERLLDMVKAGLDEDWESIRIFKSSLTRISLHLINEGVASKRFKVSGSKQDAARALGGMLLVCCHPVLVSESIKEDPVGRARVMARLLLNGLKVASQGPSAQEQSANEHARLDRNRKPAAAIVPG